MQTARPKKILIATGLYPPDIGGPATYVRMLEEKLPGHHIDFKIVPFTDVRHLPKVVRHVVYFWKLLKEARAVDAVYALDPVSVGFPALMVSTLYRKPFLVRLGGDYAWEQGQQRFGLKVMLDEYTADKKSARWQVRMLARVQAYVVCSAKKVIVPSHYMKSIVSTWGATDVQLEVIYSALFPLEATESYEALRKKFGYEGIVIFSAARLTPWKGYDVLLQVVASLVKKHPDLSLVIAGDGPQLESLRDNTKELQIEDHVTFRGRLSKEDLGKALKASNIFVLNTAYEGLSHQLLEVMDMGVPVVTTNVGGNPELIQDGVSGLIVPYNNAEAIEEAIESMIQNDDLVAHMSTQAKVRTQDFNQDTVVTDFVTLLEKHVWEKN